MTQEEILEYNKRCAELVGRCGKVHTHLYWVNITDIGWVALDGMKFHSDWNWIMEVVKAIEKLGYLIVIQSNFCQIQEIGTEKNNFNPLIIVSLYGTNKKEAVVQAINQFLIWYNENKAN